MVMLWKENVDPKMVSLCWPWTHDYTCPEYAPFLFLFTQWVKKILYPYPWGWKEIWVSSYDILYSKLALSQENTKNCILFTNRPTHNSCSTQNMRQTGSSHFFGADKIWKRRAEKKLLRGGNGVCGRVLNILMSFSEVVNQGSSYFVLWLMHIFVILFFLSWILGNFNPPQMN